MKKSFTLVEILIAVFIFSIAMIVTMSSMVVMLNSRNKVTGSKNLQEAVRLGMETITKEVKKSNREGSVAGTSYYNFAILENNSGVWSVPSGNLVKGAQLRVASSENSGGALMEKSFALIREDSGGPVANPDSGCPSDVFCYLASSIDNGTSWSRITADQLSVNKLKFSGYNQLSSDPSKKAYVEIEMYVRTKDQTDVNKKDSGFFRTTVMAPDPYDLSYSLPFAMSARLFVNGVDKGDFVNSSPDVSGRDSQVSWASWTAVADSGAVNKWGFKRDCSSSNGRCLDESIGLLRGQNPTIRIVDASGSTVAIGHLLINDEDKGEFIQTTVDLSGADSQVAWPSWTSNTESFRHKIDCASDNSSCWVEGYNYLKNLNPRVQFVSSTGQVLGMAYVFEHNTIKGKFMSTDIDLSGVDSQVGWPSWVAKVSRWYHKYDCSGDNTACFNQTRTHLLDREPRVKMISSFNQWRLD